ncbi:ABC transporter ATP-binding protein/permease [Reinekea forsetii]|nr:ABC transporter ATP-binding protein/permease [Reinekea forsetii]
MLIKALFRLIGRENRRKIILLQFLFLGTALLQVVSIASLAPFITLVSNPDSLQTNTLLSYLYSLYNFESVLEFIITYAIAVVILLVIGNSTAAYSLWKLIQISIKLGLHVQSTVYNSYLSNDYTFFAMNNSSRLVSQLTQEIPRMVYMVIQPIFTLISQLFIALIIVIGLLIIDLKISMMATAIVTMLYFIIFKTIRSNIVKCGKLVSKLNRKKLKLLDESIGGIKEVKLQGNENFYRNNVKDVTVKGLSASSYIVLSGDLPKFVVETVVFASILALAIYILLTAGTASEALGIISLYAMAGYKLLPAAQAIYKSISQIKANGSVVQDLDNEITKSKNHFSPLKNLGDDPAPSGTVEFSNVSYCYPNTDKLALDECSLTIEPNQVTAFVGTSGAGKSTAVDILLGLMLPISGAVTVGRSPLNNTNIKAWRNKIGYVAQEIFILDASFRDNIALGIAEEDIDEDRLIQAAKMANIYEFISQCIGGFDYILGERGSRLSGGQKQRIGIARALYKDPEILVFDEATSALDNRTERLIMGDILKLAHTRTVVMIAHRLSTVEQANKILVFKNGKVQDSGTYNELESNSLEFQSLLRSIETDKIENTK